MTLFTTSYKSSVDCKFWVKQKNNVLETVQFSVMWFPKTRVSSANCAKQPLPVGWCWAYSRVYCCQFFPILHFLSVFVVLRSVDCHNVVRAFSSSPTGSFVFGSIYTSTTLHNGLFQGLLRSRYMFEVISRAGNDTIPSLQGMGHTKWHLHLAAAEPNTGSILTRCSPAILYLKYWQRLKFTKKVSWEDTIPLFRKGIFS